MCVDVTNRDIYFAQTNGRRKHSTPCDKIYRLSLHSHWQRKALQRSVMVISCLFAFCWYIKKIQSIFFWWHEVWKWIAVALYPNLLTSSSKTGKEKLEKECPPGNDSVLIIMMGWQMFCKAEDRHNWQGKEESKRKEDENQSKPHPGWSSQVKERLWTEKLQLDYSKPSFDLSGSTDSKMLHLSSRHGWWLVVFPLWPEEKMF